MFHGSNNIPPLLNQPSPKKVICVYAFAANPSLFLLFNTLLHQRYYHRANDRDSSGKARLLVRYDNRIAAATFMPPTAAAVKPPPSFSLTSIAFPAAAV